MCRYLCAFCWSLRDKLRDDDVRDDILAILLDPEEKDWVVTQVLALPRAKLLHVPFAPFVASREKEADHLRWKVVTPQHDNHP